MLGTQSPTTTPPTFIGMIISLIVGKLVRSLVFSRKFHISDFAILHILVACIILYNPRYCETVIQSSQLIRFPLSEYTNIVTTGYKNILGSGKICSYNRYK